MSRLLGIHKGLIRLGRTGQRAFSCSIPTQINFSDVMIGLLFLVLMLVALQGRLSAI